MTPGHLYDAMALPDACALGKRVFAHIGKAGWAAWLAHQTMLINENRLSPLDPKHRAFLEEEMQKFLFGGGADRPAGYVPRNDGES